MSQTRSADLHGIADAARWILDATAGKQIICLEGDLGSGKTTLVKELCRQLGVKDPASSPTFSLVNEYAPEKPGIPPVFHMDLYRLKSKEEALDLGIEEYLYGKSICFIEWPGLIRSLLPKDHVVIQITNEDNKRKYEIRTGN